MASRFLVPYSSTRGWMQDPLFQLQREIDRVFEDVFSGGGSNAGGRSGSMMNAPHIDLQDSDGELLLHADLPGVQPSDLDIRIEGDVLTLRGERKSERERNEQNFHVMERSHGRFQRSIQLPFAPNPDEVQATVREGVLELRIPKRAPQERSRRIEVRGSEAGAGRPMTAAVSGGSAGSSQGGGASAGAGASTAAGASAGQGAGGSASITPKGEADSGARSGSGTGGSGASSEGGMAGASGGATTAGGTATKR
ncbi:MAG TPA: Hsp20/alpha crystallin family protein [Caldimonas sp.]|nr:Hsp20/alpha crystallin family protein [Caldimonas sp.]